MRGKRKQLSYGPPFPLAWRSASCILPGVRSSPAVLLTGLSRLAPLGWSGRGLCFERWIDGPRRERPRQVSPAAAMARCRAASHARSASATAADSAPRREPATRRTASSTSRGTVTPDSRTERRAASGVECQRVPRWRAVTASPATAPARRGVADNRRGTERARCTRRATRRRRSQQAKRAPRPTAAAASAR